MISKAFRSIVYACRSFKTGKKVHGLGCMFCYAPRYVQRCKASDRHRSRYACYYHAMLYARKSSN